MARSCKTTKGYNGFIVGGAMTPPAKPLRDQISLQVGMWLAHDLPEEVTGLSMIKHDGWQKLYDRLEKLFSQELERVVEEVIGEDEPQYMDGKQIYTGEKVTIDLKNNIRDSCIFIEANGRNNLRREQRAHLKKRIEGLK